MIAIDYKKSQKQKKNWENRFLKIEKQGGIDWKQRNIQYEKSDMMIKKYDYDWWYGDFWIFEKNKVLENWNVNEFIEYDDYSKYWIV